MNPFRSARLKLTVFYFAILVVFSLLLTFGVWSVTDHELSRGDTAQRGALHQLFERYNDSTPGADNFAPPGDRYFAQTQQKQSNTTRQNLNRDFVLLNLTLLAIGAVLSYWYAGRTLRPIEAAHEQQKRFTSDASHELRTPLTAMKLENEIFLRQKEFTPADARQLIASNLEEVDRLERLATNLLALNQYEQGTVPHAQTNITEVVNEAIASVKRHKEARGIAFAADVQPAQVDINQESIIQLLGILLDNAVKYGPRESTVEVSGALHGDNYALTVRDHGPGIAEADLPHIFERMYRGDKARSSRVSGHGIGLSLARQIAAANDATLEAHNHPDGGAEFVLHLQ